MRALGTLWGLGLDAHCRRLGRVRLMPESHFWFSPVTGSDSNQDSQGLGRCCFGLHGVPTAPSRCCFVCHASENWVLHLELLRMLQMFPILLPNSPSFSACRQRPKGTIKSSNASAVWSPLSLWLFLDFLQQFGSRLIASLEFCSGSCYAFGWSSVLGTHGDWNHIQRHWQSESSFFSPFQKALRFLLTQMFIYHPPIPYFLTTLLYYPAISGTSLGGASSLRHVPPPLPEWPPTLLPRWEWPNPGRLSDFSRVTRLGSGRVWWSVLVLIVHTK